METSVVVAISVLSSVFLLALIATVCLCVRKCRKDKDYISQATSRDRPRTLLVEDDELTQDTDERRDGGFELADVTCTSQPLDEGWLNQACPVYPVCLAVLRKCYVISERLLALSVRPGQGSSSEQLTQLALTTRRVQPLLDSVIRAMGPPLQLRLLEARCTALVLSVTNLALLTKAAAGQRDDWVEQAVTDVHEQLKRLRNVCSTLEPESAAPSNASPVRLSSEESQNCEDGFVSNDPPQLQESHELKVQVHHSSQPSPIPSSEVLPPPSPQPSPIPLEVTKKLQFETFRPCDIHSVTENKPDIQMNLGQPCADIA